LPKINFGLFFEPQTGGSGDQELQKNKAPFLQQYEGWGFLIMQAKI